MADHDFSVLLDTLGAQQHLLQKLCNELDAEREASATAASEALAVIIRLQGEKAAVKMEAEQYKRLAEEKMSHAEESIAVIEDIIYQKEMEVATLDYQLQSCRHKLLTLGAPDPGEGELTYPDNLLQRGETLLAETRKQETNDNRGNITSYAEEIRKLNNLVKEIVGPNYTPPHLPSSRTSFLSNSQPESRQPSPRPSFVNAAKDNDFKKGGVQDVFEVPRVDKQVFQGKDVAVRLPGKDEPDWLKKINLRKTSHVAAIDRARVGESTSGEEFKLLKEIKNQLDLVHAEIRSQVEVKKTSVRENQSSCPLIEAMLHFWL